MHSLFGVSLMNGRDENEVFHHNAGLHGAGNGNSFHNTITATSTQNGSNVLKTH